MIVNLLLTRPTANQITDSKKISPKDKVKNSKHQTNDILTFFD